MSTTFCPGSGMKVLVRNRCKWADCDRWVCPVCLHHVQKRADGRFYNHTLHGEAQGEAAVSDILIGPGREGVDIRAYPDGIYVSGWYDSMVGIEGGFVTWEQLDALRKKARRRQPFQATEKPENG